ncbi:hypothetical protein ACFQS6_05150 [Xanthomonas populi]|uniref:hypothetical protein n=1 Tax=Xanthomonas populi TaxID=53414 RepID=UPI000FF87E8A|nr:hypothetical protein [Xanthomonas populi]
MAHVTLCRDDELVPWRSIDTRLHELAAFSLSMRFGAPQALADGAAYDVVELAQNLVDVSVTFRSIALIEQGADGRWHALHTYDGSPQSLPTLSAATCRQRCNEEIMGT